MKARFYATITRTVDVVPSAIALAMLQAIDQHLTDLRNDDPVDASEGFTLQEVHSALNGVRKAELIFNRVLNRVKGGKS